MAFAVPPVDVPIGCSFLGGGRKCADDEATVGLRRTAVGSRWKRCDRIVAALLALALLWAQMLPLAHATLLPDSNICFSAPGGEAGDADDTHAHHECQLCCCTSIRLGDGLPTPDLPVLAAALSTSAAPHAAAPLCAGLPRYLAPSPRAPPLSA